MDIEEGDARALLCKELGLCEEGWDGQLHVVV
jgi:hypothetical protein